MVIIVNVTGCYDMKAAHSHILSTNAKLPVTWSFKAVVFDGYSGFLHYLQLASHELATIGINVTKNEIQIQIQQMQLRITPGIFLRKLQDFFLKSELHLVSDCRVSSKIIKGNILFFSAYQTSLTLSMLRLLSLKAH